MSRRLFFSTEGVDWNDDAGIEAFALNAWNIAVTEFTAEETEDTERTGVEDD